MTGVAEAIAVANPYPGLRPFREDEEYLFFGRESQIDRIVEKLGLTRFLAVVGTSGSGKSSLVNCGLRPALRRGLMPSAGTSWRFVQFRPGGRPIDALAEALVREARLFSTDDVPGISLVDLVTATLRMSNLGLTDIYEQAQLPPGTNLLVIVDQFEELFRFRAAGSAADSYAAGEEATTFVNLLLAAHAQAELPIYVVLTMRSDFLGDCAQFYGLPEAINEGQYLVPRMTRDERRAAIAGPAEVMAASIGPVLLTRLVNDTGDNPDQLSILQHALNRTWARWQHQDHGLGALALDSYEAIGGMSRALDAHAEKAFAELQTARQRVVCERVFKALTDRGTDARGVRRPTSLARLCAIADATQAEVEDVLAVFRKPSRSFLMPPVPEPLLGETVIDLSHESLMRVWKRLHGWTQDEAESARIYRRIHDTALLHASGRAGLWRDPELQVAVDWRNREHPTAQWAQFYGGGLEEVIGFLDRSKEARDQEKAEVEFQRAFLRWCIAPAAAALIALYAMKPQFDAVAGALVPALLGSWRPLIAEFIVAPTLQAAALTLLGLGLATGGRRFYRRRAFATVLAQVSQSGAPAPVEEIFPGASAPTAEDKWPLRYAGFGRRLLAGVVDGVIAIAVLVATFVTLGLAGAYEPAPSDWAMLTLFITPVLVQSLYQFLCLRSPRRGTLGMRLARVAVTDLEGGSLSPRRILLRQLAKVVSYYSVIGCFTQPFTQRRQMLHDLIVRSVVVIHSRSGSDAAALERAPEVPAP
jgi:uncharacterized RDD family membrane protein YckC/energy-coupling factor transporter ATP-binding protein EcfA2